MNGMRERGKGKGRGRVGRDRGKEGGRWSGKGGEGRREGEWVFVAHCDWSNSHQCVTSFLLAPKAT